MKKKTAQPPKRTCGECIHEYACGIWNLGSIRTHTDATNCTIYETAKMSAAYLIGKLDADVKINDDFETMLICAERYACGRQSYMPTLVIDYITPLLPKLSKRTLVVFERDIAGANGYGDEAIDKPYWMKFLADVRAALKERGKE